MAAENLNELFVEEVRDIYDAEKQLVKALPKMADAAESEALRAAFEEHLEATRRHVTRLEDVFKLLGTAARGKACEGMQGLIEEGAQAIEEMEGVVLDAALIASAQKVEHYEIATYGTLATFAEVLDMQDAKELLGQTLDEEKEADEKLTQIAGQINVSAEQGDAATGEEYEDSEEEETETRPVGSSAGSRRANQGVDSSRRGRSNSGGMRSKPR